MSFKTQYKSGIKYKGFNDITNNNYKKYFHTSTPPKKSLLRDRAFFFSFITIKMIYQGRKNDVQYIKMYKNFKVEFKSVLTRKLIF